MFNFFKTIDAVEEANEIAKKANTISEEANELSKNVQKKQYEHDRQVAKEQIIRYLKEFVLTEENGLSKIDNRHQEKIAEVGNDFKKMLMNFDKNETMFPRKVLEELPVFINKIRNISEIRLMPSRVRGSNQDFENNQIQNREKKGNELIEEARGFIKKLEK